MQLLRETPSTRRARTIEGMSEHVTVSAGDNCTDGRNVDDYYVRRINWLITAGRPDLIDEIADDCERRRSIRPAG
jgi:hypothetical protein